MTQRITPGQIKKTNRQQIYTYIYENRKVSQQEIAYGLHLSRPTYLCRKPGLRNTKAPAPECLYLLHW